MRKIAAIGLLSLSLILSACGGGDSKPAEKPTTGKQQEQPNKISMKTAPEKGDTVATLTTNMGVVKVLLYTEEVPETTKNFIELSKSGKYDNTIFHRVIKDFMIQGGDFEKRDGTGGYSYKGPGTKINDELKPGMNHVRGALSMAKTAAPNSGGSQFFIVQAKGGTPHLNGVHTVFGYAFEGMDVVDKIADVDKEPGDRPVKDVVIEKVEISTY